MKIPHLKPVSLLASLCAFLFVTVINPHAASARVNVMADKLSVQLKPRPATNSASAQDLAATRDRLIKILEVIEESNRTSGPAAGDLLTNAFQLNLQDTMSRQRMLITIGAITDAWKTSHYLGLFTDQSKFRRTISNGVDKGKNCVFEYVVPASKAPAFSTDLANIRIVEPSKARTGNDNTLSSRDVGRLAQFKSIEKEVIEGPRDAMGRTATDRAALWKKEADAAGDSLHEVPSIRIAGGLTSSPSSVNNFRWRVDLEVTNISRHPTEVTVECYILCSKGDNSDKFFVFGEYSDKLKLRSGEPWEKECWTKSLGKNPHDKNSHKGNKSGNSGGGSKGKKKKKVPMTEMRGWIARVMHNGKIVAWDASQRPMEKYFEEVSYMPRSGGDGK